MNKIFKVIWSKTTNELVVVSELASSRGKAKSSVSNESSSEATAASFFSNVFKLSAITALLLSAVPSVAEAAVAISHNPVSPTTTGGTTYTTTGTANGNGATAVGTRSIAIGENAGKQRPDGDRASEGDNNTEHTDNDYQKISTKYLSETTREGNNLISIGSRAFAGGHDSIAIGTNSQAVWENNYDKSDANPAYNSQRSNNGSAVAIGFQSFARGDQSIALGSRAEARNRQTVALGNDSFASGVGSVVVGGDDSSYIDGSTFLNGSKDFGGYSTPTKVEYDAQGNQVTTTTPIGFTPNSYNRTLYRPSVASGNGAVVVGVHSQSLSKGSTAVGVAATAGDGGRNSNDRDDTVAGGIKGIDPTQHIEATAVGALSNARNQHTTAVGYASKAFGTESTVLGAMSEAHTDRTMALGYKAKVQSGATRSMAIGENAEVKPNSTHSIAMGSDTTVRGNHIVAIGTNNTVTTDKTFAVGNNITTTAENSVFLGDNAAYVAKGASTDGIGAVTEPVTVNGVQYGGFAGKTSVGVVSVGAEKAERRIQNVAAGKISKDSTDAINGSQLYQTQQVLGNVAKTTATNLGGNSTVGPDGSLTAPTYNVVTGNTNPAQAGNSNQNFTTTPAKNVGDALTNLNTYINQGFKVVDNANVTKGVVTPGESVKFANGNATTAIVDPEAGGVTTVKYDVKVDGTTITVQDGKLTATAKAPETTTLTANANGTVKPTDDAKKGNLVTAETVANAINESGFIATSSGNQATASVKKDHLVKPGSTVTLDAGKNLEITQTDGKFSFATKDNVTFNGVTSNTITVPGATSSGTGNSVVINSSGINAGNKPITNVADGVNNTDAVNVGQLKAAKTEVEAGANTSVKTREGTNKQTIYTVHADKAVTEAAAGGMVSVDSNTTTDNETGAKTTTYTVDLTDGAKKDIAEGKKGWNLKVNEGAETKVAPGETVTFKEGKNIKVTQTGKEVTIATADNVVTTETDKYVTGGTATYDAQGNATTTLTGANDAGGAVTGIKNNYVTSAATQADGKKATLTRNDGGTVDIDLTNTVKAAVDEATIKGTKYKGDKAETTGGTNEFTRQLGTTTNVLGGATGELSNNNIGVVSNGTDTLTVKLAKNLTDLTSAEFKDTDGNTTTIGGNGITIDPKADGKPNVTLTANGLDNGGNQIKNVAEGTNGTDAVNVNQLRTEVAASKENVVSSDGSIKVDSRVRNDYSTEFDVTVNVDGTTITKGENGELKANTTNLTIEGATDEQPEGTGRVDTPATGTALVTASTVADAINKSGFTLTTSENGGTKDTASTGDEVINPGDKIDMAAGKNLVVKQDENGKVTYSTKDDIQLGAKGEPGKDGVDGKLGVNGKDGSVITLDGAAGTIGAAGPKGEDGKPGASVVLNGKDGSIGLTGPKGQDGKDGASTNLSVKDGAQSLDAKDAEGNPALPGKNGETRLVYTNQEGKPQEIANLNDGLIFTGNNEALNRHKLNTVVKVVGEGVDKATSESFKSAAGNINVVADKNDKLEIQLNRELKDLGKASFVEYKPGENGQDIINTEAPKTEVANNGITITPKDGTPGDKGNVVSLTDKGLNNGGNTIVNVKSNLAEVTPLDGKQPQANSIANLEDKKNNAATVGDVLNAGWNLQENGEAVDTVTHADGVNFVKGRGTTVSITPNAEGTVSNIQVDSAIGYVNEDTKDTSTPSNTVKVHGADDKSPVQITNVASGVRDTVKPAEAGKPITAADVAQAIKDAKDDTLTNAVNVGDLQDTITTVSTDAYGLKDKAGNEFKQSLGTTAQITGDDNINTKVVDAKDGKGNVVYARDANGEIIKDKDGNPVTVKALEVSLNNDITVGGKDGKAGSIGVAGQDGKDGVSIKGDTGKDGKPGEATITVGRDGKDGKDGKDGDAGIDGKVGVNGKDGSAVVLNGKDGSIGLNGKDGENGLTFKSDKGADGVDGKNGKDGKTRIVYTPVDKEGNPVIDPETKTPVVEEVATLNDGLIFTGNNNDVLNRHKLNTVVNIVGEGVSAADAKHFESAKGNINVKANGSDTLEIQLSKDIDLTDKGSVTVGDTVITDKGLTIVNGPSVTKGGINAGDKKVTNVADGDISPTSKDAINGSQLYQIQQVANAGWNLTANGKDKGNVVPGATVDLNNKDGNITITKSGNNVTFGLNNSLEIGKVGKDGKDGEVAVKGKDGASVVLNGKDGSIGLTGPKGADGQPGANANIAVEDGAKGLDGNDGKDGKSKTRIVYTKPNGEKETIATLNDGLKFVGDDGNVIDKKLNETLSVTGGVKDPANLSDGNIGVVNTNNGLVVKLAKDLDLTQDGSVKTGDTTVDNNGLTIKGGPSVTKAGVDAGGKKVTNVADGEISSTSKDAVNGSQLYNAIQNTGWDLTVDGNVAENTGSTRVANNGKATIKGGKNIVVSRKDSTVEIATSSNPEFDSVKVGGTTISSTVAKDGVNELNVAGNNGAPTRITNVAAGVKDNDAVNVGQLKGAVGALNNKINRNNRDLRAGIAGANAAAGLPQVYIPGKSMLAASAGTFKGENALAVGYSRSSDNGKLILKLQGNANSRGDVGGSMGVGYQW